MNKLETTAVVVLLVICGGLFGVLVGRSLDAQDKADCLTWAQEAKTIPPFYITPAQEAQCNYWKIPVNAPVHN